MQPNKPKLDLRTLADRSVLFVSTDFLLQLDVSRETLRTAIANDSKCWVGNLADGYEYEPLMQRYKDRIRYALIQESGIAPEKFEIYEYAARLRIAYEAGIAQQQAAAKAERWKAVVVGFERWQSGNKLGAVAYRHYHEREGEERAEAYTRTYMLFRYAQTLDKLDAKKLGFDGLMELYEALAKVVEVEKLPASFGNPTSLRLKLSGAKKIENPEYLYQWVIDQRLKGSRGNAKITLREQAQLLIGLLSQASKPSPMQVAIAYNKRAEAEGWGTLSETTVMRFYQNNAAQIALARDGYATTRNQFDTQVFRRRPAKADMLWIMDGTPIDVAAKEIKYKYNPATGKYNKQERTFRLYLFLVIDACTWEILGWHIGDVENHTAVAHALASAVRNTGVRPQQIQYDNGSAMRPLGGLLAKLARFNTPTAPYAPNSKAVEPFLKVWKHEKERFMQGWVGLGIRSKTESNRANSDHLYEIRNNLFTPDLLRGQVLASIKDWNEVRADRIGRIPRDIRAKVGSAGVPTDMGTAMVIFATLQTKEYKYNKFGVQLTIEGKKRTYALPPETDNYAHLHVQLIAGKTWQIMYDPTAPQWITLYKNGVPVDFMGNPVLLMETEAMPMAIADYAAGDGKRVAQHQKNKEAVKELLEAFKKDAKEYQHKHNVGELLNPSGKDSYNDAEQNELFGELGFSEIEESELSKYEQIADMEEQAAAFEIERLHVSEEDDRDFYDDYDPFH